MRDSLFRESYAAESSEMECVRWKLHNTRITEEKVHIFSALGTSLCNTSLCNLCMQVLVIHTRVVLKMYYLALVVGITFQLIQKLS